MICKIHYSDDFQTELDAIAGYIAIELDNKKAARELVADTYSSIAKLAEFPNACPLSEFPRLAARGIHKLVVHNYIVLYSVTDKDDQRCISILHLIYGARDYKSVTLE